MLLLLMVLYITAIFMTKLFGKKVNDNEKVQMYFGNIPRSMFTLFQIVTCEGWNEVARDMMEDDAIGFWISIVFIGFLMFTNLALLNLVMGIILENILTISNQDDPIEMMEKERIHSLNSLRKAFDEIDVDKDGHLTLDELRVALRSSETSVKQALAKMDVGMWDAGELFVLLDYDRSGTLSADEFTQGCMQARGSATARQVLELQCGSHRMWSNMHEQSETTLECIDKASARLSALENVMRLHQQACMEHEKRLVVIDQMVMSLLPDKS